MYVRGPQHSITGGDPSPPVYSSGGGGKYPPTLPGSTPMGVSSLKGPQTVEELL